MYCASFDICQIFHNMLSHSVGSDSLQSIYCSSPGSFSPQDFSGKITGVGCHFLLQAIFPTQGSNPGLSHCRQTLYHLSHQAEPKKNRCHSNQINTVPILKDSCTVLCFYNLLSLTKYVKLNYNHQLCNSFLEQTGNLSKTDHFLVFFIDQKSSSIVINILLGNAHIANILLLNQFDRYRTVFQLP